MLNTSRFYLARHGETTWNTEKRLQGQLNSPLTEKGLIQARQLAISAAALGVTDIISSDLTRAKETANVIAKHLQLSYQTLVGLEERHFGQWQGLRYSDIADHKNYHDIFQQVTEHAPPNGESAQMALKRFIKTLHQVANDMKNKSYLIISHGDIIRCFLTFITKKSSGDAYSNYKNGCLISIDYCHVRREFKQV